MLTVPHPDKVIFPAAGLTRKDVLEYYAKVAPAQVIDYRGRILTVIRYPHGIDAPGFYQKHPHGHAEGEGDRIEIQQAMDVLSWAARGVVEWHVPLGLFPNPYRHDWAVIDLDPNPPAGWELVSRVAGVTCHLLHRLELPFRIKTSGKDGLHLYIAIEPAPHEAVTEAIRRLCVLVAESVPDWATIVRKVADRGPRVYLDYLQNGYARTMAGVFSLRAIKSGTVSTPIAEEEIPDGPERWTTRRVVEDLARRRELWPAHASRVNLLQHLAGHRIL